MTKLPFTKIHFTSVKIGASEAIKDSCGKASITAEVERFSHMSNSQPKAGNKFNRRHGLPLG